MSDPPDPDDTPTRAPGHGGKTPEEEFTGGETMDCGPPPAGVPQRISGYLIRRVIASGGMGTVYQAMQENPRRSVAVKIMKPGVTSPSALRRFEYEAQLLARLSHPGIAQIYEAGTHDGPSGQVPFFAMEYIPNARTLTDYADRQDLGIRQRLEIFARVCEAIHHGHTKGIIHRDLKPGNIMVDSSGQPKIIDFGVARATDSDLVMPTLQTSVGDLVGTLQYMSPEQCEADPQDIDTRSDIYSLGVILFQMLHGQLPYDITRVPIHEAARIIRESQPDIPGTNRSGMNRDVRTIVAKAMEKQRERRYQSALGLAQDIHRWLGGEAIEARPPSLTYQLAVFSRRNRAVVAAASAFVAALAIGLGFSTYLYLQARQAEALAEEQRERAVASLSFMEDMIFSADPVRIGDRVRVGDLLDSYSLNIPLTFAGQPETEARIRTTLGRTYLNLYLFERMVKGDAYQRSAREHLAEALRLREEALGEEHPDTLNSMDQLAAVLVAQELVNEAEPLARRSLALHQRIKGDAHPHTVAAMSLLTRVLTAQKRLDEADPVGTEALQICRNSADLPEETAFSPMESLADLRIEQGRADEAEVLYKELALQTSRFHGAHSRPARQARSHLGGLLMEQGRLEDSAAVFNKKMSTEPLGIQAWLQGETTLTGDEATIVVFWEAWCPFSQREVPEFEKISLPFRERGLTLVGFSTAQDPEGAQRLIDFVQDKKITFPIAQVTRESRTYFDIGGTPGAAAIKDGRVVFEGELSMVTAEFLETLLK